MSIINNYRYSYNAHYGMSGMEVRINDFRLEISNENTKIFIYKESSIVKELNGATLNDSMLLKQNLGNSESPFYLSSTTKRILNCNGSTFKIIHQDPKILDEKTCLLDLTKPTMTNGGTIDTVYFNDFWVDSTPISFLSKKGDSNSEYSKYITSSDSTNDGDQKIFKVTEAKPLLVNEDTYIFEEEEEIATFYALKVDYRSNTITESGFYTIVRDPTRAGIYDYDYYTDQDISFLPDSSNTYNKCLSLSNINSYGYYDHQAKMFGKQPVIGDSYELLYSINTFNLEGEDSFTYINEDYCSNATIIPEDVEPSPSPDISLVLKRNLIMTDVIITSVIRSNGLYFKNSGILN